MRRPSWDQPWCEIGCYSVETVATFDWGWRGAGRGQACVQSDSPASIGQGRTPGLVGTRAVDRVPPGPLDGDHKVVTMVKLKAWACGSSVITRQHTCLILARQ
jgi:hypothetical protein